MKKLLFTIVLLLGFSKAFALSYQEARDRALYLTDKMAYELNLTSDQYDNAYQINLDYLMSISTYDDCYSSYWYYRNNDLRYVLSNAQYALFTTLDYFYRPIRWISNNWYYPVTNRYSYDFYYFSRPTVYATYYGHPWSFRRYATPSPYRGFRYAGGYGMREQYRSYERHDDWGGSYYGRNDNRRDWNRGNSYRDNGYNNGYSNGGYGNNNYGNRNNGYRGNSDNNYGGYGNNNYGRRDENRGQSNQGYNRGQSYQGQGGYSQGSRQERSYQQQSTSGQSNGGSQQYGNGNSNRGNSSGGSFGGGRGFSGSHQSTPQPQAVSRTVSGAGQGSGQVSSFRRSQAAQTSNGSRFVR